MRFFSSCQLTRQQFPEKKPTKSFRVITNSTEKKHGIPPIRGLRNLTERICALGYDQGYRLPYSFHVFRKRSGIPCFFCVFRGSSTKPKRKTPTFSLRKKGRTDEKRIIAGIDGHPAKVCDIEPVCVMWWQENHTSQWNFCNDTYPGGYFMRLRL